MCEKTIKFIYEKRREYLKVLADNVLLTDEEYYAYESRIELLNEILSKIKGQNIKKNDIIIA